MTRHRGRLGADRLGRHWEQGRADETDIGQVWRWQQTEEEHWDKGYIPSPLNHVSSLLAPRPNRKLFLTRHFDRRPKSLILPRGARSEERGGISEERWARRHESRLSGSLLPANTPLYWISVIVIGRFSWSNWSDTSLQFHTEVETDDKLNLSVSLSIFMFYLFSYSSHS